MSIVHLVSLALSPPFFIVAHTLAGLLMMPIYGVDKWRWRAGAIEVMAGRKKDGSTRIWFKPGAQTWGLVIFCANGHCYEDESLQVHERVHVLQTYVFGVLYPITYLLSFLLLFVAVKLGAWKSSKNFTDDDIWHAYRKIPWELWAYRIEDEHRKYYGRSRHFWGEFR